MLFTGEKSNLLADKTIWKDGSKVASSENVSLTNRDNKTEKMTADNSQEAGRRYSEDRLQYDWQNRHP